MELADKAYKIIKSEITTCVLAPGEQIAQSQLALKYRVGLTPIREALQRLAQEGLVESIPRFGYIVSPVTIGDIQSLYEFRSVLERGAIRLAVERASDAELEKIVESAQFKYTFQNRKSYVDFIERNNEFHSSIAAASGNTRLCSSIAGVLDELARIFHLGLDLRDSAQEMYEEHIALANALKARDAENADQLYRSQNDRSEERVREALMGRTGSSSSDNVLVRNVRVDRVNRDYPFPLSRRRTRTK